MGGPKIFRRVAKLPDRAGHVLDIRYEGGNAILHAHVPPELSSKLATYENRARDADI